MIDKTDNLAVRCVVFAQNLQHVQIGWQSPTQRSKGRTNHIELGSANTLGSRELPLRHTNFFRPIFAETKAAKIRQSP